MARLAFISGVAGLALASPAAAQLDLHWSTIDGGGVTQSFGGSLELSGTIGQTDAGMHAGDALIVTGGVWDLEPPSGFNPVSGLTATAGPERVLLQWTAASTGATAWVVERRDTGAFAQLASVPATHAGGFEYLDPFVPSGVEYTYRIVEAFVSGLRIPRVDVTAEPYSANLPVSMARVGGDDYRSIQLAIDAAPPGTREWIVTVEPGSYGAFAVRGSAPPVLRIFADGTGPVRIDASSGPVLLGERAAGTTLELRGLEIDSLGAATPSLSIEDCAGVVILDSLTVVTGTRASAVELTRSGSVSIQRCDLRGQVGLALRSSNAYASHTDMIGTDLDASVLTTAEVSNSGTRTVSADSRLTELPGTMPIVDTPTFTALDVPFAIDVKADPAQSYGVFIAIDNRWIELPFLEMVVLFDLSLYIQLVWASADADGHGGVEVRIPANNPALHGRGLVFQGITLDQLTLRMSNAVTKIALR